MDVHVEDNLQEQRDEVKVFAFLVTDFIDNYIVKLRYFVDVLNNFMFLFNGLFHF